MDHLHPQDDSNVLDDTRVEEKTILTEPPMYKVWLLNDDFTPTDFVVDILREVFGKPKPTAIQIMLHVHRNQRGLIAIYPKDIAEHKEATVAKKAQEAGHPLRVQVERDDPKPA